MINRRCISYHENDPANLVGGRLKLWKHFAKENENKQQPRSPRFRSKCEKTNSCRSSHPNGIRIFSGIKSNAFDIPRLTIIISARFVLVCFYDPIVLSFSTNLIFISFFSFQFCSDIIKANHIVSTFDIELVTLDMTHTRRDC